MVERGGTVRVVKNGAVLPTPFIDVSDEIGGGGERGLLSIAFAPDYAVSGLVYSFATLPNGTLDDLGAPRGARRRRRPTPAIAPSSASRTPPRNHNGGQLQFGPDGYLYIGVGDGGSGSQRPDHEHPARQDPAHQPARGGRLHRPAGSALRAERRARDLRLRPPQPVAVLVRQPHGRSPHRRRRRHMTGRRSTSSRPASRPARTSAGPAWRARTSGPAAALLPAPSRRSTSTRTTPRTARSAAASSPATPRCRRSPAATSSPTTAARASSA